MPSEIVRTVAFAQRIVRHWGATMAIYGGTLTAVGLYFTDWKLTNDKIPFYGKKFDDEGNL